MQNNIEKILSISILSAPILEIYGIKGPEIYPVLPKVSKKQFGQLNRMMMSQPISNTFTRLLIVPKEATNVSWKEQPYVIIIN